MPNECPMSNVKVQIPKKIIFSRPFTSFARGAEQKEKNNSIHFSNNSVISAPLCEINFFLLLFPLPAEEAAGGHGQHNLVVRVIIGVNIIIPLGIPVFQSRCKPPEE